MFAIPVKETGRNMRAFMATFLMSAATTIDIGDVPPTAATVRLRFLAQGHPSLSHSGGVGAPV